LTPVLSRPTNAAFTFRWPRATAGRRFWNQQGRRYARSFFGAPTTRLYLEEEQALLRRHLGDLQGLLLLKLDLWNEAQNTEILLWAAREGATCYGIDIAETTALKARARGCALGVPIRIAVADAAALPYSAAAFDCVYTMGTLEHVPDVDRAFAEIARVMKPGGVAIVGVPNRRDPFLFWLASRTLQAIGYYPYGYERWYTNGELRRRLGAHGLRVDQADGILFLPWFLRIPDLCLWLHLPSACRLTELLVWPFRRLARLRCLVRRFGYLTVCVAHK
jgi:SAM-dependent methyltransferase